MGERARIEIVETEETDFIDKDTLSTPDIQPLTEDHHTKTKMCVLF